MRFYVLKKRTIYFVFAILISCVLLSLNFSSDGSALASVYFLKSNKKVPIYCVENSGQEIALTFDAAWGSDKTEKILEILRKNDITATFFLVGFWVDKNEDLVRSIDAQGLEIGTHSNTHPDMAKLSKEQTTLELSVSKDKIEAITNKPVKVFRAPFGSYNNTLIEVASGMGLKTIQWDVDSLDWRGISGDQICKNILTKVKSGSIILCHNNSDHIVDALPSLILTLKSRGYKFLTVSSLVLEDNYSIDATGKQKKI